MAANYGEALSKALTKEVNSWRIGKIIDEKVSIKRRSEGVVLFFREFHIELPYKPLNNIFILRNGILIISVL